MKRKGTSTGFRSGVSRIDQEMEELALSGSSGIDKVRMLPWSQMAHLHSAPSICPLSRTEGLPGHRHGALDHVLIASGDRNPRLLP
jgi:hypothetical protein